MELCAEKTKIVIFKWFFSSGKRGRDIWKWGNKKIEEVKIFKYLGFTFNSKRNYKDHIRELKKKDRITAKKVWRLGERICKDDFPRKWMYKYLVQNVMTYRVEIWGWEEKKELEKVMMDYIRWIFRLDFNTPRYIILGKLELDKNRVGNKNCGIWGKD